MISIRHSTEDEVSDLQHLNKEVFVDNATYDTDLDLTWAEGERGKKYFSELLHDIECVCFIAEDEGKKIGYLAAGPKLIDYRNSRYIEIQNMGVIPEYQSRGVGKQLMEACLQWAKSQGYQKAFVNAYIKNQRAIDFYKRAGFSEIDISLEKHL